jgi:protease IV
MADPAAPNEQSPGWERGVLEKLAFAALQEQRKARRWGIFFKILTFLYLLFLLVAFAGWRAGGRVATGGKHTALVELRGVIAHDSTASADFIMAGLKSAFENSNTKGVVLRINSPGGSPVQAGQINAEIRRLRAKHKDIPFYVVVDDVCASGGYYVAVAAEKIYVDKASLVGSIGVLMDGFGFTGTMDKLGVERRLLTAGEHKGFLDPFSPRNPTDEAFIKTMLGEIHQQFIQVVRDGRGNRLQESKDTFSGLIWSGERSIAMGLADAVGSVTSVARDVIKAEDIVDFTPSESVIERLAKRFGVGMGSAMANQIRAGGAPLR